MRRQLSGEAPLAGARSVGMTTVPHILANHVRRRRWRAELIRIGAVHEAAGNDNRAQSAHKPHKELVVTDLGA